jgi:prevent-host-death family protein
MKQRVLSASEFKSKYAAYLEEIEKSGESITITKRGRPVAVLGPVKRKPLKWPGNSWKGKARILGDIVNTNIRWECAEQVDPLP